MIFSEVQVDTKNLQKAIIQYAVRTTKHPVEIVNQRTLNVARWAFEAITPKDPRPKSEQIKDYMNRIIVTKVRFNKTRGRFVARGKRHHLRLKHLIVQSRRAKQGLKGLYGDEMRYEAGKFSAIAQSSVGYIKSVFIPIFVGLNRVVKFKMPFSKTRHIARWKNSAGSGFARPAKAGWNIIATMETHTGTSKSGQIGVIQDIQNSAMEYAIAKEENELWGQIAKKMRANAKDLGATVK